ncbi:hypothetical protein MBSD_n0905 [Mizugakiibacter sediminis]|uniref:DUF302 domain-containing protein n=1 Tax=Mizugakiibacter sediminis TaxID=1475481 RepID=A0A0K8QKZ7_9GAMM|nr:DUF302 domain-containing protein [Mizugakiibacter sediminis]GAP65615.1 hypothetical protein MBSD_n0905 [Mizugakiibacter sediminis]
MYYIVKSDKSFAQAVDDLDAAVRRHRFGVLHVHDLGATLRNKGQAFAGECKVFEVCSPRHAAGVLASDLRLNMALPCRISVYTEGGETRIGMIEPQRMLAMLSDDPALAAIAREVEDATRRMIDEAR